MTSALILFNKPCGVICQFTSKIGHRSLKEFISLSNFYPAGRLDTDSEGLVLLTNDGELQNKISNPKYKLPKTYWVQVEGIPSNAALERLRSGINLRNYKTLPAQVHVINEPENLWPRTPPIRFRKNIPTTWIALTLTEGKNRQVRHMTAAIACPTMRLIRYAVGRYTLQNISSGQWNFSEALREL